MEIFFKRSVIADNRITFSKGVTLNEDRFFVCRFLMYAKKVCCIPDIFYNYFMRTNGGLTSSILNFNKMSFNKEIGVIERGKLRALCTKLHNIDIFNMYIGTVVVGALEIIVRGASLPIDKCYKATVKYCSYTDVKEAYNKINFHGLPLKYKIPAMIVRYRFVGLLVVFVHFVNRLGIRMNAI